MQKQKQSETQNYPDYLTHGLVGSILLTLFFPDGKQFLLIPIVIYFTFTFQMLNNYIKNDLQELARNKLKKIKKN
jgi:hypothetical protein